MPTIQLITNVKLDDTKEAILELSKRSANILSVPEKFVCATIIYDENLAFSGTFEPAIILNISSLDNLNLEKNEQYSKEYFQFFLEKFGVSDERAYIGFVDPGRSFLGYKGTTFATIFSRRN
ncbi:Tautomerase/MIF superfamily [Cyathus striatus]|nr:Tautomerase/MIF superfamily [Cyathus striatus]